MRKLWAWALLLAVPAHAVTVRTTAPVRLGAPTVTLSPAASFTQGPSLTLTPTLATPVLIPSVIAPAPAGTPEPTEAPSARRHLDQAVATKAPQEVFDGGKTLKERLWEGADLAAISIPVHLPAAIGYGLSQGHAGLPLVMAAVWHGGSEVLINHLGTLRQKVVGGWQASHDQKYRTSYTDGTMKDIRGNKYGSDRYEEYAPGKVSVKERVSIAAFMTSMGLLWTSQHSLSASLLFLVSMFGLTAVSLWLDSRRPPQKTVENPVIDR